MLRAVVYCNSTPHPKLLHSDPKACPHNHYSCECHRDTPANVRKNKIGETNDTTKVWFEIPVSQTWKPIIHHFNTRSPPLQTPLRAEIKLFMIIQKNTHETYTFILRANSQITATGAESHPTRVGAIQMSPELLDTPVTHSSVSKMSSSANTQVKNESYHPASWKQPVLPEK